MDTGRFMNKQQKSKSKTYMLNATVTGQGPTVVLLHGYLASSAYWQVIAKDLAHSSQVVTLDLLGFGKSPKPNRSRYDYEAQIASVDHTLDSLGISRPFTLIGHSMGSLIALRYARLFPAQVQKLLLTNMPILLGEKQARQEILGTNMAYRLGLRPGLHWAIWPLFRLALYWQLVPETIAGKATSQLAYIFQSTPASRLRSMRNVIYAATVEADLKAVEVSTLILSGLQDRARYIQNLTQLQFDHKLKQQIKVLSIPGGHQLPLTHPQLVSEYVRG